MASPVSCRNRNRRCLKSQIVRMVRVKSRIKISKLALSCRWLSSAILSVTSLSNTLLSSPRLWTNKTVSKTGSKNGCFNVFRLSGSLRRNFIVALCEKITTVVCWFSLEFTPSNANDSSPRDRNKNTKTSCFQNKSGQSWLRNNDDPQRHSPEILCLIFVLFESFFVNQMQKCIAYQ